MPSDLGMQHHLQQQIAQFLLEVVVITMTDGISHLVGLLQHVGHQGRMGLFQVPGTARCWMPELCHDLDQSLYGVRWSVGHAGSTTGATPTLSLLSCFRPFLGPWVAVEDQMDPCAAL